MAAVLGKRKAREAEEDSVATVEQAQEVFRRHFEAQFKPLQMSSRPARAKVDVAEEAEAQPGSDPESSESGWGGISDDEDEDDAAVEIIDHSTRMPAPSSTMTKHELKAFMSSRPPDDRSASEPRQPSRGPPSGDVAAAADDDPQDEDSATLLANDLALQRLIAESHLLSRAGSNPTLAAQSSVSAAIAATRAANTGGKGPSAADFAGGRTRLALTDLRLRGLGSKESIFAQERMPMAMRRGIAAAARGREEKRRREARENGIVLERATAAETKRPGAKRRAARGEPAVDLPGMGRMRGAELRLSRRDVRSIEGGSRSGGPERERRRRKRRR